MDFDLTEEHKIVRNAVREFAQKEVAPRAEELDRTGAFPYDLVKKCGEIGVTSMLFPESIGGSGADTISYSLALEEIARADMSLAVTIFCSVAGGIAVHEFGKKELVQEFVPPIVKGEAITGFALTEPDAGSDNRSIRTTAFRNGDEIVINGTKCFVSNGGTDITKFVSVFAIMEVTSKDEKKFGIVLVPNCTPGFEVSKEYQKMGWRSSNTVELHFDDCRVPAANVIVNPGEGMKQAVAMLAVGRIGLSSSSIGLAQACIDASLKYAKARIQFNRPISAFQRVQDMLVEMAVEIDAARLLTHRAAFLRDQKRSFHTEASVAKLYATEAAKKCADFAVQIHGGYGYIDEYAVSRYYRDIRIATIGDGTSQIQRMIIAKALGCKVQ